MFAKLKRFGRSGEGGAKPYPGRGRLSSKRRPVGAACLAAALLFILSSCGAAGPGRSQERSSEPDCSFHVAGARASLRIVSGSENRILEPLLETFSRQQKINLDLDYNGSLEIMRLLGKEVIPYDAVWPASGLWISLGDEKHRVKHQASTSSTPVIFGVRRSLAKSLGWDRRDVRVADILAAIRRGDLSFTMTSATQSNSGASAYIGFIYALLGSPGQISLQDLQNEGFRKDMTELLAGVERSSGSSDWLKDLFLQGNYDAMVNYEALIISANQALEKAGREPLYAVYPVDGMMMANSPLGFVSANGQKQRDEKKQEEAFMALQNYLLSEPVQAEIQRSGRRTGLSEVRPENKDVFRKDWGIDTERVISTINMPKKEVLFEALNLYQRAFKKPGLNVYVLDFSGSMRGEGRNELIKGLGEIMLDEKAAQNFLQASENEKNIFIPFSSEPLDVLSTVGSQGLSDCYKQLQDIPAGGGTSLYEAVDRALQLIMKEDLSYYSPSVIVMTDGQPNGLMRYEEFSRLYLDSQADIPIFSILFGDASESEMAKLAALSKARVFDGRSDLQAAFRTVRGYN